MLHKFFSRSAVFAMVTLVSLGASAANDGSNGVVTLAATSYKLWTNVGSSSVIRISVIAPETIYNASGTCTDPDSYMVSSTLPADARQRIYSTLLSAKLAGRPVRLYIDSNICEDNRPRVNNVTIE
jgi:hypothetical protein